MPVCERNASVSTGTDRVVAQYLSNTCHISQCFTPQGSAGNCVDVLNGKLI
jgi:hypothetical protein